MFLNWSRPLYSQPNKNMFLNLKISFKNMFLRTDFVCKTIKFEQIIRITCRQHYILTLLMSWDISKRSFLPSWSREKFKFVFLEFFLNKPETGKTALSYSRRTGILIGLHDLKRFQLHCDFFGRLTTYFLHLWNPSLILQHIKKLN